MQVTHNITKTDYAPAHFCKLHSPVRVRVHPGGMRQRCFPRGYKELYLLATKLALNGRELLTALHHRPLYKQLLQLRKRAGLQGLLPCTQAGMGDTLQGKMRGIRDRNGETT